MKQPRVSVLMPVYNGEKYLAEAIESILAQTFTDFEFLIMNDGSKDRTAQILEEYAAKDQRIRIFHRVNRGIVATLNEQIELAHAEFLARMDADDIAMPERFAKQVQYLEKNPDCVLVASNVVLIDPDGCELRLRSVPLAHEEITKVLLETTEQAIYHPATMFRRKTVLELGGYRGTYLHVEDLDLFLRLGEVGLLATLPEPLLKYREHMGKVGAVHAQVQGEMALRVLLETYGRRGITPPATVPSFDFKPTVPAERHRVWAWWALGAGHVATSRKHALAALRQRPFSGANWALLACAIRGR